MKLYVVLIVLIVIILYCNATLPAANKFKSEKGDVPEANDSITPIVPLGYISSKYMDNYKWMPIKYSQSLYNLFELVNLVHPGDILFVKDKNNYVPVGLVVSVMEIDKAFPVIVLDRSIEIGGREFGVAPTDKSIGLWNTTLYPDILKTPVTEIQSVSRWVVGPSQICK
jgi:hypothetical protein